jgi:stearoyl-CoA desaturase (delta-9 desaturase)
LRSALLGVLIGVCTWQLSVAVTSIYLHREVSHGAIELGRPVRAFCRAIVWLLLGISPAEYAFVHRAHHLAPDTDSDPHSPRAGVLRLVTLLPFVYRSYLRAEFPDQSPRTGSLKHSVLGPLLLWCALASATSWVTATCWLVTQVGLYTLSFGFLAAFSHTASESGGERIGFACDIPILAPIMGGEFMHAQHHYHPGRWHFDDEPVSWRDPGGIVIALLLSLGLARVPSRRPRVAAAPPMPRATDKASSFTA